MKKLFELFVPFSLLMFSFLSCKSETEPLVYHTVSFDTVGGTFVLPQQVQDGKTAVEPKSPQKNGYSFSAWYNGKEIFDFSY